MLRRDMIKRTILALFGVTSPDVLALSRPSYVRTPENQSVHEITIPRAIYSYVLSKNKNNKNIKIGLYRTNADKQGNEKETFGVINEVNDRQNLVVSDLVGGGNTQSESMRKKRCEDFGVRFYSDDNHLIMDFKSINNIDIDFFKRLISEEINGGARGHGFSEHGDLQRPAKIINVIDFGAVGDGETDNTNCFQAAFDFSTSNNIPLYIPAGRYLISSAAANMLRPAVMIRGGLTLFGDGMYSSIIYCLDEKETNLGFFYGGYDNEEEIDNLNIYNLGFEGSWGLNDNYRGGAGKSAFFIHARISKNLNISRCYFYGSRYMFHSITGGNIATVSQCHYERSVADACRVSDFNHTIITDNYFKCINDDAIAVHTLNYNNDITKDHSIVVSGNNIVDSQGICALGAKNTVINGNVLLRVQCRAISVGMSEEVFKKKEREGTTAPVAINISNNTISDVFSGKVFSQDSGKIQQYIYVGGVSRCLSCNSISSKESSVSKYGYIYENNIVNRELDYDGALSITIANNNLLRTLYDVEKYSDYGLGRRLGRNGYVNPSIVIEKHMCAAGIEIEGAVNGLSIYGNNIENLTSGIRITSDGHAINPVGLRAVMIYGNTIFDFFRVAIELDSSGYVDITNNHIDGDPHHKHTERASLGRWIVSSNSTVTHCAIKIKARDLWATVAGNTFKNVMSLFEGDDDKVNFSLSNALICYPDFQYRQEYNQGIAIFPQNKPIGLGRLIIANCDPKSEGFDKIIRITKETSTDMPKEGVFYNGEFIRNSSPVIMSNNDMRFVITGWLRVTNGDGNKKDIDWVEMTSVVEKFG